MRRLGPRRLEAEFGAADETGVVTPSPYLASLEARSDECFAGLDETVLNALRLNSLKGCIASSDVHEYGKRLVESLLHRLDVEVVDGGVSVDPEALAGSAVEAGADFIALSTYNGVALDYVRELMAALDARGSNIPVFIGGKINQIPEESNTALPVDVSAEITALRAFVCRAPAEMFSRLARLDASGD